MLREITMKLPMEDDLWAEIEDIAAQQGSSPESLAEFLTMLGLYHHVKSNIEMYRWSMERHRAEKGTDNGEIE